jgi:hypothetical protein
MKPKSGIIRDALIAVVGGFVFGASISAFSPGNFLPGFWLTGVFLSVLVMIFILAIRFLKTDRKIVFLALCAFVIRIVLGTWLTQALPQIGFDTPVQKAGYVYSDAYTRDQEAYRMAWGVETGLITPDSKKGSDQYGGLLFLSKSVYKLFSSEVHRPLLMVALAAFMMSLGILFLWAGVNQQWGNKIAIVTSIVLAFYPEGVLLGSSQMREPFLIGLACVSFWSCLSLNKFHVRTIILLGLSTLLACWISIPGGAAILIMEIGFLIVTWINTQSDQKKKKIGIVVLAGFVVVVLMAGWIWLKETLYYDAYLTETNSGMVAELLQKFGTQFRIPFAVLYGLIQPVLPAALVYQSLPIWQGIGIFRAIGWYLIVPFLLYGFGAILNRKLKNRDWSMVWFFILFIGWVIVSSARAGGDQWDNPRYRAILLPWTALIIGWVWNYLSQNIRPWFWRIVALEILFVVIFTNWYLYRKFEAGIIIPFNWMFLIFGSGTLLIIGGGIIWDRIRQTRQQKP